MTPENTKTSWRGMTDELTDAQVAVFTDDEASGPPFDSATLLFMAPDLASVNLAERTGR